MDISKKSIKIKLCIMFVVLIISTIIISEVYTIFSFKKVILAQTENDGLKVAKNISLVVENGDKVSNAVEKQLEDQIYTACQIVLNMKDPSNEALKQLAKTIGVTEIALSNKDGVVLYSNFDVDLGFRYKDTSPSRKLLTTDMLRLDEPIKKSDTDGKYYKYGSATLDHNSFVQIGIVADKAMTLINENSAQTYLNRMDKSSLNYAELLDEKSNIVSSTDKKKIGKRYTDNDNLGDSYINSGKIITKLNRDSYIISVPYKQSNSKKGTVLVSMSTKEMNSKFEKALVLSLIITLILIAVVVVIINKVIAKIISPLTELAEISEEISKGDLTKEVKILENNDEIGKLSRNYEKMVDNLKSIIADIKYSSNNIINSSDELAAFSEEVSATAEEITGSIQSSKKNARVQNEEVGYAKESLDNLSKKIALINEVIDNLRNSSKITSELTISGRQYLVSLNESINNIGSSSKNINIKIGKLHDKSSEISTIVQVINSISEQTNLLALNAAIEAARVGDAGKGFAVVADEIRSLSEQSGKASDQIEKLIKDILKESNETVKFTSDSEKIIGEGISTAKNTEDCFNDIIQNIQSMIPHIQKTTDFIEGINKSKDRVIETVDNAAEASNNINESFTQISTAAEDQSSSTEQLANIASKLNDMSLKLKQYTDKFKISSDS